MEPKLYRKLFIKELREENGNFYLQREMVKYVDIIGTLVSIEKRPPGTVMELDDNTAIIKCVKFHDKEESIEAYANDEEDEVEAPDDEDFAAFVKRITTPKTKPLHIGDLVNVFGRLKAYEGELQMVVEDVVFVSNPNMEWFRIREIEAHRKFQRAYKLMRRKA